MKQAIRALGWAIYIFWIILLFFAVTAVYSVFQLVPAFGEPYTNASDESLTLSLPFYINNGGFYDISNLQLATYVKDNQGSSISDSSTTVPCISRGSNVSATHTISIDFSQMAADVLLHLLFNDSTFEVEFALRLNYANAVPFGMSGNFSMPWGAPLSNLTVGGISLRPYNASHLMAAVPVSFENHSPIGLDGTMRLELVDSSGHTLGDGTSVLDVLPESNCSSVLELVVPALGTIHEARLFFDTSAFNYGPVVILVV